tara:strand:- start:662 stop:1282 length:621 start_codon:yes stop_codon:yes gene_type:complete
MLKVWGRTNSINVQKVMWLIGELGLDFERIDAGGPFGGLDKPDYLAMNPTSRIPTIDDNGFTMWESHAIVRYLASKNATGTWYPSDAKCRAHADQWMDWLYNGAYQNLITAFLGLYRTSREERDGDAISKALHICGRELSVLDSHLSCRTYVLGENISMGDIPAGCITYRWFAMDIERPKLPHLAAWYARLEERPAFREHAMIPLA